MGGVVTGKAGGSAGAEDMSPEEREELSRKVDQWLNSLGRKLEDGFEAFAYESLYIPVDSAITGDSLGQFDITSLQHWGALGWQVVAVIPRTVGVGLTNNTGVVGSSAWGGGIGGNVAGVHVILSRRITSMSDEAVEDLAEIAQGLIRKGRDL